MCVFAKELALKVAGAVAIVVLAPLVLLRMLADLIAHGEHGMEAV